MKQSILFIILCGLFAASAAFGTTDAAAADKKDVNHVRIATLAGGCFWCTEADMEKLPGVLKAVSGYAGGWGKTPTYETYAKLGYVEAVQVHYDPKKISYADLVGHFLKSIDPTDAGGQFADRGAGYRSVIFYRNDDEKRIAEASLRNLAATGNYAKPIVTEVTKYTTFYPAESDHQDFYKKNPLRYHLYRVGSGRQAFFEQVRKDGRTAKTEGGGAFQKPDDATLRKTLSRLQYEVTQKDATEPPFQNAYFNHKQEGIYVDIVSGEPLFSSRDKYDSGTGWPSFTRPLEPGNLVRKTDRRLSMKRTEVRSRLADSHLGHVFEDGPAPDGLRYCINSAALRFIPTEHLEKEGYGRYLPLFSDK